MNDPKLSQTFHPQTVAPKSVYIHIPFCRHRCGYCNFTLVAGRDYLIDRFLDALETEIGWLDRSYEIETLFFGGGTPSHLSPANLERLSQIVLSRFTLSPNCEVTAECNPSDLNHACAQSLARCHVTRISLGVQSLNGKKLRILERDHDAEIVRTAINNARRFASSVSLDMIFASPRETLQQWQDDLGQSILLQPDHFSAYELTYEKGTSFWNRRERGQLSAADEELRCQMYEFAIDTLARYGFWQYEISSFAKPGHECLHNNIYWSGQPYFAFGPGASRFVDGIRETNHQSTTRYLSLVESGKSPVAQREQLLGKDSALEQLVIGLRCNRGVMRSEFVERTGFEVSELIGERLRDKLLQEDLLQANAERVNLTHPGLMVCDWIAGEIMGQ